MNDETHTGNSGNVENCRHQTTCPSAAWDNDTSFDALIAGHRLDARETKLGAQLDQTSAFLLPLMLALARLAAQRHASELADCIV
jgi:hypothetical protein